MARFDLLVPLRANQLYYPLDQTAIGWPRTNLELSPVMTSATAVAAWAVVLAAAPAISGDGDVADDMAKVKMVAGVSSVSSPAVPNGG
jgi:hypothetical protein